MRVRPMSLLPPASFVAPFKVNAMLPNRYCCDFGVQQPLALLLIIVLFLLVRWHVVDVSDGCAQNQWYCVSTGDIRLRCSRTCNVSFFSLSLSLCMSLIAQYCSVMARRVFVLPMLLPNQARFVEHPLINASSVNHSSNNTRVLIVIVDICLFV
jgi:hypothetical protein